MCVHTRVSALTHTDHELNCSYYWKLTSYMALARVHGGQRAKSMSCKRVQLHRSLRNALRVASMSRARVACTTPTTAR